MSEIRPFERGDLEHVAGLMDRYLPSWGGDRELLRRSLLDYPWAEPDLPSLVALDDDGGVIGFIGAQVRRLRFDERELRAVCCSHLVVDSARHAGAAGALLLSRLLAGPQDLTWSDTANAAVVRMWRTFGGQLDNSRVCDWMLVLRPERWIRSWAGSVARRRPVGRDLAPVKAIPSQLVDRRPERSDPELLEGVRSEPVGAEGIVEHQLELARERRLAVDHDADQLGRLLELIASTRIAPVARLVRRGERPIGWYVYLPPLRRAGRVLAISARDRDAHAVLAELVSDARSRGCPALAGRLDPHLEQAVRRRNPAIGLARQPVLRASDPQLLATLASAGSLLTQLDGEWWVT